MIIGYTEDWTPVVENLDTLCVLCDLMSCLLSNHILQIITIAIDGYIVIISILNVQNV